MMQRAKANARLLHRRQIGLKLRIAAACALDGGDISEIDAGCA